MDDEARTKRCLDRMSTLMPIGLIVGPGSVLVYGIVKILFI